MQQVPTTNKFLLDNVQPMDAWVRLEDDDEDISPQQIANFLALIENRAHAICQVYTAFQRKNGDISKGKKAVLPGPTTDSGELREQIQQLRFLIPKNAVPRPEEGRDLWDDQMGSEVKIESNFRRAPAKSTPFSGDMSGAGGGRGRSDSSSEQQNFQGGADDSGSDNLRSSRGGRTQLSSN